MNTYLLKWRPLGEDLQWEMHGGGRGGRRSTGGEGMGDGGGGGEDKDQWREERRWKWEMLLEKC